MKEVRTNIAIYALLRIHVIGGQSPVRWSPSGSGGGSPTHALLRLTSPSAPSRRHPGVLSVLSPVSVGTGPWQRTGAVGEGGPAHPDDTHGGALQPRWRTAWKSLVAGPL